MKSPDVANRNPDRIPDRTPNRTPTNERTYGLTEKSDTYAQGLQSPTCAGGAKAEEAQRIEWNPPPPAPHRFQVVRTGPRDEIPIDARRAVYLRDGFRCHYCGVSYDSRRLDLDHMIPWSAGGSDLTHNLRTLCEGCNTYRSNYDDRARHKRVLPVTWWCIDCHGLDASPYVHRPSWVRPAPPHIESREGLTFAYCAKCDINSYTEVTL